LDDKIYKTYFIKLGIFTLFIAIILGILIYSSVLSRKSWQKNLRSSVEKVLDEADSNTWIVGNYVPLNNTFTINAACYEVNNRKSGLPYKAIIIRVTTFYGPVALVFTIDEDENVEFKGVSSLHGRIASNLSLNKYSKRIEYWETRIPYILK
jgi:hypothetical protein